MEIILVRHGETDWNKNKRCQGISDIDLNETGLKQAEQLKNYFYSKKIDAMFTSNLKRAKQTANIINFDDRFTLYYSEELREMNQGDFEGVHFDVLNEKYLPELTQWRNNPDTFRIPNGETLGEVQDRIVIFMNNIVKKYSNLSRILIVSHNLVLSSFLCFISNGSLKHFANFTLKQASISTINYSEDIFSIKTKNSTQHLIDMQIDGLWKSYASDSMLKKLKYKK